MGPQLILQHLERQLAERRLSEDCPGLYQAVLWAAHELRPPAGFARPPGTRCLKAHEAYMVSSSERRPGHTQPAPVDDDLSPSDDPPGGADVPCQRETDKDVIEPQLQADQQSPAPISRPGRAGVIDFLLQLTRAQPKTGAQHPPIGGPEPDEHPSLRRPSVHVNPSPAAARGPIQTIPASIKPPSALRRARKGNRRTLPGPDAAGRRPARGTRGLPACC